MNWNSMMNTMQSIDDKHKTPEADTMEKKGCLRLKGLDNSYDEVRNPKYIDINDIKKIYGLAGNKLYFLSKNNQSWRLQSSYTKSRNNIFKNILKKYNFEKVKMTNNESFSYISPSYKKELHKQSDVIIKRTMKEGKIFLKNDDINNYHEHIELKDINIFRLSKINNTVYINSNLKDSSPIEDSYSPSDLREYLVDYFGNSLIKSNRDYYLVEEKIEKIVHVDSSEMKITFKDGSSFRMLVNDLNKNEKSKFWIYQKESLNGEIQRLILESKNLHPKMIALYKEVIANPGRKDQLKEENKELLENFSGWAQRAVIFNKENGKRWISLSSVQYLNLLDKELLEKIESEKDFQIYKKSFNKNKLPE